jgi:hypothetical protein
VLVFGKTAAQSPFPSQFPNGLSGDWSRASVKSNCHSTGTDRFWTRLSVILPSGSRHELNKHTQQYATRITKAVSEIPCDCFLPNPCQLIFYNFCPPIRHYITSTVETESLHSLRIANKLEDNIYQCVNLCLMFKLSDKVAYLSPFKIKWVISITSFLNRNRHSKNSFLLPRVFIFLWR